MSMFDRLEAVEDRYEKLNELLSDPDVVSDPKNCGNTRKNNRIFKKP